MFTYLVLKYKGKIITDWSDLLFPMFFDICLICGVTFIICKVGIA